MRVLLIPRVDLKSLDGDSVFDLVWRIVPNAEKMGIKAWFYVLLPKGVEGNYVEGFDNVTVVYENREFKGMTLDYACLDTEVLNKMFSTDVGEYQVDGVFTTKVFLAVVIRSVLVDFYALSAERPKIPVVVLHPYVPQVGQFDFFAPEERKIMWMTSALELPMLFLTDLEYQDFLKMCRDFLSYSGIRRVVNNSKIAYAGFDPEIIDRFEGQVKKKEKFTLFTSGLAVPNKKLDFVFELYGRLYELGHDFGFSATTPSEVLGYAKLREVYEKYKNVIELKLKATREEYVKTLLSSHCWISASVEERTGIKWLEMMYSGVPGVVNRMDWSEYAFGKDYRLFYENGNLEDAISKVLWVHDNYDEAKAYALEMRKKMFENKSTRRYVKLIFEVLKENLDNEMTKKMMCDGKSFSLLLKSALKEFEGSEFTLVDFLKEVKAKSSSGLWLYRKKATSMFPTTWEIHEWLKYRGGCVDLLNSEYPVYRCGDVDEAVS